MPHLSKSERASVPVEHLALFDDTWIQVDNLAYCTPGQLNRLFSAYKQRALVNDLAYRCLARIASYDTTGRLEQEMLRDYHRELRDYTIIRMDAAIFNVFPEVIEHLSAPARHDLLETYLKFIQENDILLFLLPHIYNTLSADQQQAVFDFVTGLLPSSDTLKNRYFQFLFLPLSNQDLIKDCPEKILYLLSHIGHPDIQEQDLLNKIGAVLPLIPETQRNLIIKRFVEGLGPAHMLVRNEVELIHALLPWASEDQIELFCLLLDPCRTVNHMHTSQWHQHFFDIVLKCPAQKRYNWMIELLSQWQILTKHINSDLLCDMICPLINSLPHSMLQQLIRLDSEAFGLYCPVKDFQRKLFQLMAQARLQLDETKLDLALHEGAPQRVLRFRSKSGSELKGIDDRVAEQSIQVRHRLTL